MSDDLPKFDPERDSEWRRKANRYAISRYKGGRYRATQYRITTWRTERGTIGAFAADIYYSPLK